MAIDLASIHYKISYAQNREDLILSGILKNVENGFYIDVGANHPELDSVTKIFYDRGWSGINLEPNPILLEALIAQRPRDICLQVGASSQTGTLVFRSYKSFDGLSTFSQDSKDNNAAAGEYSETSVQVVSLADVISEHGPDGEIHFLKIDVEGMELEVILGNRWKDYRPWVLCIERTIDPARYSAILAFLNNSSYNAVFNDGINDYFVANERMNIWHGFSYAADVIMNGVPLYYIFTK